MKLVFNVESASKHPQKHSDNSIHKIDIFDTTCDNHVYEVLNFQKSINVTSGNPSLSPDPMVESLSPSLTPFGDSDLLLEETDVFLSLDDSIPPGIDDDTYDSEGDILFLERLLDDDPSPDLPPTPHPLPVIIAKDLRSKEKEQLPKVLKSHKRAIAWKISDIRGINPNFCTHKILMEEDFKPAIQQQRRVNPKIYEVIKAEVIKLLDAGLIYPISDSPWMDFLAIFKSQLIPKTRKRPRSPVRMEHFAYRRMPFGLCNAPGTFQRCMMAIFHDMIEKTIEEKCHFMVKEGIVLGHKISKNGLEVDRAKVEVIKKLPPPTTVKGVRSFLGHAVFRFFKILKRGLTEAPIIGLDWGVAFELIMTSLDAQTNYTVTQKELLAVVYAFEKFRSYLVLLLHEFTIEIHDKKGAENLAADHLSRLENPYQGDHVGMEINDNYPHESLSMISLNPDNKPPWFADIANYLVGNTGRKLWTFSKLAIMDPPGDTMARTTPRKKFLTQDFSGPPFIEMPRTLSHIVTRVSVRERSHNGTKCPKILFRFVRFSTSRASTSWGRSHLQEGTDIFSWLSTMFRNGLKRKRSPPTTPE
ncbi:reverse transcriptase domain-containing protein [Tanacetum coccineum]